MKTVSPEECKLRSELSTVKEINLEFKSLEFLQRGLNGVSRKNSKSSKKENFCNSNKFRSLLKVNKNKLCELNFPEVSAKKSLLDSLMAAK